MHGSTMQSAAVCSDPAEVGYGLLIMITEYPKKSHALAKICLIPTMNDLLE